MAKVGLLLVNLGTPDGPEPAQVRKYLKEFLMDPLVIDIPYPLRWFLVNLVILRTRPEATSKLYKKIWTDEGSPLMVFSVRLLEKLREALAPNYAVELAMRYGSPSIQKALEAFRRQGVQKIYVLPLYPQYSLAATQSTIEECQSLKVKLKLKADLEFIPAFYSDPGFISAFAKVIAEKVAETKPDKIIFSYHGLPERHVKKTDETKKTCLMSEQCCDSVSSANKNCYRAQCFATSRAIAKELNLSEGEYLVSFQSRLGRTPWIRPHSDILYLELAKQGVRKILVACPSFVADCLETLEEVAIRGRADFKAAGGEDLNLVSSLNDRSDWVEALVGLIG